MISFCMSMTAQVELLCYEKVSRMRQIYVLLIAKSVFHKSEEMESRSYLKSIESMVLSRQDRKISK